MARKNDGTLSRTFARCDACGSIYVAKVSPDGSFSLDGAAACSCDDSDLTLVDPPAEDISR